MPSFTTLQTFINIHAHFLEKGPYWQIINIAKSFEQSTDHRFCSLGLHPWHLQEETWPISLEQLLLFASQSQVLAIGECGLDKVCNTPWTLQEKVFQAQIRLANDLKKPLIIHCVRAFQETVSLLKAMDNRVPLIFHGFNKALQVAKPLLAKGYYLSFGKSIVYNLYSNVLQNCPLSQLFLETDDAPISIQNVYKKTSQVLNMPIASLQTQLTTNFQRIFS